jgi:hypothetical protein
MKTRLILFVLIVNACMIGHGFAQTLPLVYSVENTGATYPIPTLPGLNELPVIPNLPDPFMWADGRGRIANFSDWRYRRAEIAAQIQNYEIGVKPVRPDSIQATFAGNVLTVKMTVNGKTLTLTSQVVLPAGPGPFPAVIGMGSGSGSIPSTIFTTRNIALITFNLSQVTTYGSPKNTDPYYQLYPYLNTSNTGQYSAWIWGVSRIIDALELTQNVLPIDLKHLAVSGCSYAGKMALFSGAFDERIALTISQESGGGGYTTWRVSELKAGEVETLGATDYNWFKDSMKVFSSAVSRLPEDHHELMAMVAPRALLVTGNPSQIWLSDESGYVGSRAAKEVYKALGIPERFGYSILTGHNHCAVPTTQYPDIQAMVDKFMLGKDTTINVSTNIIDIASNAGYTTNLAPWITWTNPTLANGDSPIKWTSLSYPTNLQTNLDTAITFRWNKAQGADKYIIQVSTGAGFTSLAKTDSTTSDTTKTFSGLAKGKTYYWRVKVISAGNIGLWSNVSSFITITPFPTAPKIVSTKLTYDTRADAFTFTWNAAQYADSYVIQITFDPTFATVSKTLTTTDTTKSTTGLLEGYLYYWRVQAKNMTGVGPWSAAQSFNTVLTGVKEAGVQPTEYSLSQNYPNPFNPSTTFTFSLAARSFVSLKVFDVMGRDVATIVSENLDAGNYSRQWNAAAMTGGVYFYRLQAGTFTETKSLILLK